MQKHRKINTPFTSFERLRRRAVLFLSAHKCQYCGGDANEVDHIVASTNRGRDEAANIAAVCNECNRSKGVYPLHPDLEKEVLRRAAELAPLIEDMIRRLRSEEERARDRRRAVLPWRVPAIQD